MDLIAYVYKIDISKGYELAKLTNKLTISCNYLGISHFHLSFMKGNQLYYMYDSTNLALIDAKDLRIIK